MIEETLLRIAVALEKLAGISQEKFEPLNFRSDDEMEGTRWPCEVGECPEKRQLYEKCPNSDCTLSARKPYETHPTLNDALEKTAEDAPVAEPPKKKKRGRPTKEEAAAKAAEKSASDIVEEAVTGKPLPVEQPKCADCGTVLTAENSSKLKTGALFHVGCTVQEAREANAPTAEQPKPVELKIEKVREAALAFTKAREAAAPGTGRQAFIDVLAGMGAKTLADVPQPKWAELVQKLEVR